MQKIKNHKLSDLLLNISYLGRIWTTHTLSLSFNLTRSSSKVLEIEHNNSLISAASLSFLGYFNMLNVLISDIIRNIFDREIRQ